MPLRFFVTPTLLETAPSGEPTIVPKATKGIDLQEQYAWGAIYPVDPTRMFCLLWIRTADLSGQLADPDNEALPELPYEAPLSTVFTNSQLRDLGRRLTRFGVDISSLTPASTLEEALKVVANNISPGFTDVRAKA